MLEEQFVRQRPAAKLRPYIDHYVGYSAAGAPGALHRGLPSRYLTMIVAVGEPIEVLAQADPGKAAQTLGFVLAGLQVAPCLIAADGPQEGVAVELTPLGARALLGAPARALVNSTVEAEAVMGSVATELRDRLQDDRSWPARFGSCDVVLSGLLRDRPSELSDRLRAPWQLLVASGGTVGVSALADRVGWSRRYLARQFVSEFGLPPKALAKVIRFERACGLLRASRPLRLVDVALRCGYYDQSHLNRDFVALAGCSPTRWLSGEFPSVQDRRSGRYEGLPHD